MAVEHVLGTEGVARWKLRLDPGALNQLGIFRAPSYQNRSVITMIKVWGFMAVHGFTMTSWKRVWLAVKTEWQDA